jgi:hypothetical protein
VGIIDKLKELSYKANEYGINIPLLRDPNADAPSVTMTMMVIAFTIAALGLIGKFTKVLGEIDTSGANYLFLTTAGLYLGRKMSSDSSKKTVDIDKEDK